MEFIHYYTDCHHQSVFNSSSVVCFKVCCWLETRLLHWRGEGV